MKVISVSSAAAVVWGLWVSASLAQRGQGDPQGVALQPARPKVVSLSGEVLETKTEPCQMTTGRSRLGTHLIMKTSDGKTVNIHLGPADAVEFAAKRLSRGQKVEVEAFRTKKIEKGQYIARSLTLEGRTVELRDKSLRPKWAGTATPSKPPQKKVVVTAAGPSLDAAVDPRFGRCPYFILVGSDAEKFKAIKNANAAGGNAGVKSAKTIAAKGAKILLTGKCGPSASRALSAEGIQVVAGCSGTVRDVIRQYNEGKLKPAAPEAAPRTGAGRRSSGTGGRGRRGGL